MRTCFMLFTVVALTFIASATCKAESDPRAYNLLGDGIWVTEDWVSDLGYPFKIKGIFAFDQEKYYVNRYSRNTFVYKCKINCEDCLILIYDDEANRYEN